ncbi:MAG: phosphatase PAP2 family protein [Firmicutes bacterium]|nr:phosphatase PAP2 family protein [Bacillota bacterium]
MRPRKNTIESFDCAFQGLFHALRTQRHMRWHVAAGAGVFLLALGLRLTRTELLALSSAVALVLLAEMFNTAIEVTVDLFTEEFHPLAATAKNVAAGAVLVAALYAILVGYLVFIPSFDRFLPLTVERLRRSPPYLTLAVLILVVLVVLILKILGRRKVLMQGGMPSGHTAVAFALATTAVFLARQPIIAILALLLALLVAESRLETRIHSFLEVLAGAAIGTLLALAVFQFFYRLG